MFKFFPQYDQMDCGPACLQMIAYHHGKKYTISSLREKAFLTKDGVSLLGISEAAQSIGYDVSSYKLSLERLVADAPLPCILHWNQNHFVVLYEIRKKRMGRGLTFKVADPGHGRVSLSEEAFNKSWRGKEAKGIALLLTPNQDFETIPAEEEEDRGLAFLMHYVKPYRKDLLLLILCLVGGSLVTLLFPFLTQSLIDRGIAARSMNIIVVLLLAQLFLFVGSAVIDIVRNWIILHVGTKINLTIISDFLIKLMRLPIRFFDTKMMGDFTQRIHDHERIEHFLTSQSLFAVFSLVNLSVFFVVLGIYNMKILLAYALLTFVSVVWMFLFLRKRQVLDYLLFQRKAENQESIYELIHGMEEIKLNSYDRYVRRQWEMVQLKLYRVKARILSVDQLQVTGFSLINQLKNIVVTFLAAREVILGHITLGAMMSVMYIIGQMNSPLSQLISFFRSLQDARISIARFGEIHQQEDEVKPGQLTSIPLPDHGGTALEVRHLSFQYEGPSSPFVLRDVSFCVPRGKVTAVVGASGSGKTSLMKLLLKFYLPSEGSIEVEGLDLRSFSSNSWRSQCGVVMQDGYIFSESIARNIATGSDEIDEEKLRYAAKIANMQAFIEGLPQQYKTKIGAGGNGLSGGQKQRILIARAVYKDPQFLFFDEATSALDADNEKTIIQNLNHFFKGRTVFIIAHRLSTVKNADQIIVLNNGQIEEIGNHSSLVKDRHHYFHLVRNQLELGV
ncbi:peptidase domain-containing ABC transporter [Pontibacter korlensis]|uniref:ABC transporter ATP-binding protein n=1 Tax=Pontibacter korlensis TaxID=400092 RepID=A0A0E3ZHY0_9BACT|nr:peptidase domain-containing ABC transporter [Pontibacter korlensis]AKD04289.1 ABC transporter ATP-binding protein [Pontibacter korlensis]